MVAYAHAKYIQLCYISECMDLEKLINLKYSRCYVVLIAYIHVCSYHCIIVKVGD